MRRGFSTGEVMVVLVVASPIFPSKNNFVKALRKVHPEISTVVLNINDKNTSMVLASGKSYFMVRDLSVIPFVENPSVFHRNPSIR